jgi:hypothetical protein
MDFECAYVYAIKIREFRKTGENVIKAGHSDYLGPRIKAYPKGSVLIASCPVRNGPEAYEALTVALKKHFVQRMDIGRKYFEGAPEFIKAVFDSVAMQFFHVPSLEIGEIMKFKRNKPNYTDIYDSADDSGSEDRKELFESDDEEEDNHDDADLSIDREDDGKKRGCDSDSDSDSEDEDDDEDEDEDLSIDLDEHVLAFYMANKAELVGSTFCIHKLIDSFRAWILGPKGASSAASAAAANAVAAASSMTMSRMLAILKRQFGVRSEATAEGLRIEFKQETKNKRARKGHM